MFPTDSWVVGLKFRSRELDCSASHGFVGYWVRFNGKSNIMACFPTDTWVVGLCMQLRAFSFCISHGCVGCRTGVPIK